MTNTDLRFVTKYNRFTLHSQLTTIIMLQYTTALFIPLEDSFDKMKIEILHWELQTDVLENPAV